MYRPTKANLPHISQTYESDFDNHPIYKRIGGWVADKDTGELKYKLGKLNWSKKIDGTSSILTGGDGDVVVTIPAFYYRFNLKTREIEIDSIVPSRKGTNGRPGFNVYPAFLTKSGKVKPYILVGAYKGHVLNNQLRSISGVKPPTSQTIATFTDRARNGRNTGLNHHDITRFYERMAINILMYFEFGTFDTQTAIGKGWSEETALNFTGTTNELGDRSGYLGAVNGKASVRWRGIEDPFGNVWEFVTGFMISDAGYHFTNDTAKFLNLASMETYAKDLTVKVTNGYIREMEQIPGKEFLMIPKTTGGSSATYYCDNFWSHDPGEENIALVGGAWADGARCGAASWTCHNVASIVNSAFGARLSCSEED